MENAKKGNKSIIVIGISFLLIIVGVVLIVTGNNKSFLDDDKSNGNSPSDNTNSDNNQNTPVDNEPNRDIDVNTSDLTEQDVINLIFEKKNQEFNDELWNLGVVSILAHDETKEKYLVQYEKIDEVGNIETLQTIVSIVANTKDVELPGWHVGERDLSVYNFTYINNGSYDNNENINNNENENINNNENEIIDNNENEIIENENNE